MVKKSERVVKVDSELLEKVEDYINKAENRLRYRSNKQFIDIAVHEKLEREKKRKT